MFGGRRCRILFSLQVVATPHLTVALGSNKVINPSSDKTYPSSLPKPTISTTAPEIVFRTSILPTLKTRWDADPIPIRSSELTNPLFTVLQQSFF